nr:MAG TPA: hypothetical protein [Caudoviricetes sp.]
MCFCLLIQISEIFNPRDSNVLLIFIMHHKALIHHYRCIRMLSDIDI